MNVVTRAQLAVQMLTLLKKYHYAYKLPEVLRQNDADIIIKDGQFYFVSVPFVTFMLLCNSELPFVFVRYSDLIIQ